MKGERTLLVGIVLLVFCTISGGTVCGQGRGQGPNPPIQALNQALAKASAAALDTTQESALQAAIAGFRSENQPPPPDAAEKTARDNYANAILAGDKASAKTAADQLAAVMAQRQQIRVEAEAAFAIQVLGILHGDQIAALQNSIGKEGLLRLLTAFAGPGGPGFGRGMMGRGPMNAGPMRNRM